MHVLAAINCARAGENPSNQQNIFHRWLKGETELQREKIRLLLPAILRVLPREIRHRLSIYDTIERRALLAAQHAIGTAIDAHDDAIEAVYSKAYQPDLLKCRSTTDSGGDYV